MENKIERIGDQLIHEHMITEDHLRLALRKQRIDGGLIGDILVYLNFITEDQLASVIASRSKSDYIELSESIISAEAVEVLGRDTSLSLGVMPIDIKDHQLTVATDDPNNLDILDSIRRATGIHDIKLLSAPKKDIKSMLNIFFTTEDVLNKTIDEIMVSDSFTSLSTNGSTLIVRIVDQIISYAIRVGATDIHFEPQSTLLSVRIRIDGVMNQLCLLPGMATQAMIARIKVMANMDSSNKRAPQDGRISISTGKTEYELRVSTLPVGHDNIESVILRVMSNFMCEYTLNDIGVHQDMQNTIKSAVGMSHGMVLVSGPTGSGKTTTLYSCLSEIDTASRAVFSVEDPVESVRPDIQQITANGMTGISFGSALREILRQDPDVIMVGEIRDKETARTAVSASLTGHLVLSSIHTNSAIETIFRLIDMGIEPYMVSSVLSYVMAQRLIRKVCVHCSMRGKNGVVTVSHEGCDKCGFTGYRGRTGVFELLHVDDTISSMINEGNTSQQIYEYARHNGFKTMYDEGMRQVSAGITTKEEVLRVTSA